MHGVLPGIFPESIRNSLGVGHVSDRRGRIEEPPFYPTKAVFLNVILEVKDKT
jgi:hypothetical protein